MVLQSFKDKLDESIDRIDQATDQSLLKKIKNLKEIRVSTDIELKSIAEKTKISMKNLKSIESLSFEKLPSEPWRNSFISQYCDFIENFNNEKDQKMTGGIFYSIGYISTKIKNFGNTSNFKNPTYAFSKELLDGSNLAKKEFEISKKNKAKRKLISPSTKKTKVVKKKKKIAKKKAIKKKK